MQSVDGSYQANPWTFYIPSSRKGTKPRLLGTGKDANTVEIDASTEFEFELGISEPKGILQKGEEWHKDRLKITIKALEPDGNYASVLNMPQMKLAGQKKNSVPMGYILLRKGLKPIQKWEITGVPVPNGTGLLKKVTDYMIEGHL